MPEAPPSLSPFAVRIDADELERTWHLLRDAAKRFDQVARQEGWPVPFAPVRVLLLARLDQATSYGLSARRLARLCRVAPSTLAYHLDALENAALVSRAPWTVGDRRKVAVRLTTTGSYAVRRMLDQAPSPRSLSPAMASP